MRGFLAAAVGRRRRTPRRCEFVEAFAKPYPSLTIANLMGADLADAPRLHHWSNWIQAQFDFQAIMNERDKIEQAVIEFYEWAHELLERRRDDPGDDLISTLLAAEAEGDRLSDVECVNLVLNVLVGGVDTTQSQLAQAIRAVRRAPRPVGAAGAAAGARGRRGLGDPALRADHAVHRADHARGHGGSTTSCSRKGTIVLVGAVTANREVERGEDFDITAERPQRLLTFGAGIHYCLGANLARAELEEALTFLAPRMPGLRLDGEIRYGNITGIYGLDQLPVAWG